MFEIKKYFHFDNGIIVFSLTACGNRTEDNFARQEPSDRQEISEKENNPAPAKGTESSDNTEKEEMDTNSDIKAEGNSILVAYFPLQGSDMGWVSLKKAIPLLLRK